MTPASMWPSSCRSTAEEIFNNMKTTVLLLAIFMVRVQGMDKINFLQAVSAPLEIPTKGNFIKMDQYTTYDRVYIESRTSMARITFKDGTTFCYNAGYYPDQLWQIDPVGGGFYTIKNIHRNYAALFYNGEKVNSYIGPQYNDQMWRFEYEGSGYYRIINKLHGDSKLFLQTSGAFGAYSGPNYDDQLWRIVPETYPSVMLHGIIVGGRLVGKSPPFIYRGEVYKDQTWRLIPVDIEEETTPRFVYIQNVGTGRKLAQNSGGDFVAYDGNNYPDQIWELRAHGAYFQLINRIRKCKIFANTDGNVGCYNGPDYEDQNWMLLSPSMKQLYIKSKATGAYLSFGGINKWTIIYDLNGGYYLQDSENGKRAVYNGNNFFLFEGPIYSDQIWFINTPHYFSFDYFQITNKKYDVVMYSASSSSVGIKFPPISYSEIEKTKFYIEWAAEEKTYNEDLIDQISENNMFWIHDASEDISTCPRGINSVELDTRSGDEENGDYEFFGFHGLDDETDCVYRVCRPDEDIANGIHCSDQCSTRTVAQHVASGSRFPSRFISTSSDLSTALLWAFYRMDTQTRRRRDQPLRIVRIYLNRVRGTAQETGCVNLNAEQVREHFIQGAFHRNWVISSREVLFQFTIPPNMYDVVENPEAPPQPPRKRRRQRRSFNSFIELVDNLRLTN